jgi:hypothetical protein
VFYRRADELLGNLSDPYDFARRARAFLRTDGNRDSKEEDGPSRLRQMLVLARQDWSRAVGSDFSALELPVDTLWAEGSGPEIALGAAYGCRAWTASCRTAAWCAAPWRPPSCATPPVAAIRGRRSWARARCVMPSRPDGRHEAWLWPHPSASSRARSRRSSVAPQQAERYVTQEVGTRLQARECPCTGGHDLRGQAPPVEARFQQEQLMSHAGGTATVLK